MKIKFDSPSSVHISYETTEEELLIHWLSDKEKFDTILKLIDGSLRYKGWGITDT